LKVNEKIGSRLKDKGSRFRGLGFKVQRFRVQGSGFRGSRFWVQDSGFKVQRFRGSEVRGSRSRVQGSGLWVQGFKIQASRLPSLPPGLPRASRIQRVAVRFLLCSL
jgi:hypothetical protein